VPYAIPARCFVGFSFLHRSFQLVHCDRCINGFCRLVW
jgi:hypothetical protein